ncbi:MAG: lytic transglycosylase domain-containing protein, partial [Rubrivivax sp.]|nr:lytic transglycosylase domain-containing protein [Rubrivivax sp.]
MTPARRALLATPLALLGASLPLRRAHAGAQVEEPLADAVRTALAASVAEAAPPKPRFERVEDRLAYLRWLGAASERLKRRKAEHHTRVEFLEAV